MSKYIFIERKQYSEVIEKRIRALKDGYRQNIALIGDELLGKTALLFDFIKKFQDNKILVIYLEIRAESLRAFSRRFIAVMLYNFLENSGDLLKEDLEFLIDKSSKYIPRTVEKINSILSSLEKRKKNDIFSDLLSLCDDFHQETMKFCVVIFDEFHNLEKLGVKNLYSEWSNLLVLKKNTLYIITSSLKLKARRILSQDLSLLFGNFEVLTVEPFDINTSESYLKQKLHGFDFNKGLKDFMVHFTGGNPFYLKVLSDGLLESNTHSLVQAIEEILFDSSGILNQRFSDYIKRLIEPLNCQDYISILYLIASGHNKLKTVAYYLHKPKAEIDSRIEHLLESDILSRSADFLKINDRVFSFWLKFVYQEKIRSLTIEAKNQKNLFRSNIEGMINEFLVNAEKPIIERVSELLHLFEDDTIQMEKKRLRLTQFREIKPLEFNKGRLKHGLIGRSNDSIWIIAFKHDSLTEDDITEFADECRKYRNKLQKKIIVAFRDIDANARLRALEEKIWTWDINNLNQILDLFSKPRVIL